MLLVPEKANQKPYVAIIKVLSLSLSLIHSHTQTHTSTELI